MTSALAALVVSGGDRRAILLPFGALVVLGLLALAAARFELFVAALLLLRASLDATKLGTSSFDTTGAISVLFIVASAVWLLARPAPADAQTRPATAPLIPPLGTLFVVALLSAATSQHPLESGMEAVRMGTLVVIAAVLGRVISDGRRLRLTLGATLLSAVVPLLLAGSQLLRGEGAVVIAGLSRIDGTFLHPNPFAAYLGLIITLGAAIWTHLRGWPKTAVGLLVLACGGALVLTYARGAWLGTLLALVIVGVLQDRRILLALAAGVVVVAIGVPSVHTRFADLSQQIRESGAPANSLVWRFEHWREVLAIQRDPVIGIGLRGVTLDPDVGQLPHNDPIRVYVELGIVGAAAYVWLFVALAREARSALRRAPPGLARGLAVAFAASLASVALQSFAANIVTQLVILWYFMAVAALAMAAPRALQPAEA